LYDRRAKGRLNCRLRQRASAPFPSTPAAATMKNRKPRFSNGWKVVFSGKKCVCHSVIGWRGGSIASSVWPSRCAPSAAFIA